jgi:hypothetical protein
MALLSECTTGTRRPVWVKFKTTGWGLLELSRLAQTMLLERMNLLALLGLRPSDQPLQPPLHGGGDQGEVYQVTPG